MTRLNRILSLLLLVATLCGFPKSIPAKVKQKTETLTLFERSRLLSDLETDDANPYQLSVVVHVLVDGSAVEGHYDKTWVSKDKWRDSLAFPRFNQTRIFTDGRLWRVRDTNHEPLPIAQFLQGLLNVDAPSSTPAASWDLRISQRHEGTFSLECATFTKARFRFPNLTHELCFDSATGLLMDQEWSDWNARWEYSEYLGWENKKYPRLMRILQGGKLAAEGRVTSLERAEARPNEFAVPEGAEEWVFCKNEHLPVPNSPFFAQWGPAKASDVPTPILVEVGKDGTVQDAVVLRRSADAEREHGAVIFLKQHLRFQPAKCGKQATPFSLVFELPM